MINSAITPITAYAMSSIKLPKGVIENIDRARKQCLWRGNSEKKRGGNLVAWPTVQLPKEKGGLGIINLSLQNDALLMKHLNKFYNRADIPWVRMIWSKYYSDRVPHKTREVGSFWWKDILRLNTLFRGIAKCNIGNGKSVCFWEDLWMQNDVLAHRFPRLESFTKADDISVFEAAHAEDLDSLFMLPFSPEAHQEFQDLQHCLELIEYDENSIDTWTPIWRSSYSSKKFYSYAFKGIEAHHMFKEIWKSRCIPRIKFFIWLILVDRLNTKDMLQRRHLNIEGTPICVMCNTRALETIDHLFFECPFARECWLKLGITWDTSPELLDRYAEARASHTTPCFTEVTMIATWELWKLRNDKVFQRHQQTLALWFYNFKFQCISQSVRFKDDLRSAFCIWLDAFS